MRWVLVTNKMTQLMPTSVINNEYRKLGIMEMHSGIQTKDRKIEDNTV
jgi:hypothetical protein